MNKREKMYSQIKQHGENLNAIFNTGLEPIALCKKLRRLEIKAHKLAEDYCNGKNGVNSENWEIKCEPILNQVNKILKVYGANSYCIIFINGYARGYALKLYDSFAKDKIIYKDWGGYGILAPDFSN